MGDLITGAILLAVLAGAMCAVGTYFAVDGEPGWSVLSFFGAIVFTALAVLVIEPGYKKLPIETKEVPQVDTTIVFRNGMEPDTTFTYKFDPKEIVEW